jgi:outer membrane protein
MKKFFLALVLNSLVCAPLFAAELKIAVVDIQKALGASKQGQEAQKRYEQELKRSQMEIDKKKNEFDSMQSALEKQRPSLNPKALAEKEEKLLAMEKDLKRSFQDKKEELRRENLRLVGELVGKIRKSVEEIASSDGYTIVLERGAQGVLFSDAKVDITDKVVKRFDSGS